MSTFFNSSTQIRTKCPLKKPEYCLSFIKYDSNGMYIVKITKIWRKGYLAQDASGFIEIRCKNKLKVGTFYEIFGKINGYLMVDSIVEVNFYDVCIKLL